jgi:ammonia channel protein AmtB
MLYDTKEFNSDDRQGMSAYVSVIYSLLISIIIMFVLYYIVTVVVNVIVEMKGIDLTEKEKRNYKIKSIL